MNALAKRWVDALRSGKYKQTSGKLYDIHTDGYCCLGVLCDISGIEWSRESFYIPEKVRLLSKLRENFGPYGDTNLAYQNDHGKSFSEIADIIEQHPELFEE